MRTVTANPPIAAGRKPAKGWWPTNEARELRPGAESARLHPNEWVGTINDRLELASAERRMGIEDFLT
jgi:hypothetical protein